MPGFEGKALKSALINKAKKLGFVLAGVTSAHPPESYSKFQEWVSEGNHADMGYLASERSLTRRSDPKHILPECQSILVLGVPYNPAGDTPGGVAAYALGEDYHEVLKPRLQELVSFIEEQYGRSVPNRWYTDTGPLLERDLARRAGLGWIGKNSMLINPQSGSYFLLAEILLGLELPPDDPFPSDHCGSCSRCLESCPTGCILPDRTLDSGRCISYLTIENKGQIPNALREQIGEWLFGCDVCQQVCPWNRFAREDGDPSFTARAGVPPDNLVDELRLSAEEFNQKFKGSPVKRAKRRGYLRNAAIVLGNRQRKEDVSGLAAGLGDSETLVRQHVAWALGRIGGEDVREFLRDALTHESDPTVILEIETAVSKLDSSYSGDKSLGEKD
jgi:epoxyqueuosine reductase